MAGSQEVLAVAEVGTPGTADSQSKQPVKSKVPSQAETPPHAEARLGPSKKDR